MSEAIPIGKVAGIPLRANWSVLVILWLFTWSLASTLPTTAPGYSRPTYWLAGLAGALVLLASLMAHELTHAVIAQRAGVKVSGVTLWLFGGVTRLEGEARSPRTEFRIAASGPAVSLGLGLAMGLAAAGLKSAGIAPVVVAVAWWLAGINVMLGLFNLLPGAPLDGGRIVMSFLWHRSHDRTRAVVGAARSGRILAYTLIGLGLLQFLRGWMVGGVWTAFIGWFVFSAAREEEMGAVTKQALAGVRVADAMTPQPRTVPGWISVDEFIHRYLLGERHSAYPVQDEGGSVVGLVCLDQVRQVRPEDRAATLVGQVAVPLDRVPTAAPDEPLTALLARLTPHTGHRILVLDRGGLVGIVTPRDITRLIDVRELAEHP